MTDFASNDKAALFTERVMRDWLKRLGACNEPRPSTATYNRAFEAVYDAAKELASLGFACSTTPP